MGPVSLATIGNINTYRHQELLRVPPNVLVSSGQKQIQAVDYQERCLLPREGRHRLCVCPDTHTSRSLFTKGKAMHLCLVSSDRFAAQVLQEFLTDLRHEVEVVQAIGDLIGVLERVPGGIDLVLLDAPRADKRCLQLLRQVRERYPELLMVLMADYFPLSPEEVISLGIHRYLRKPIHLDELEFALQGLPLECARCRHRRGEMETLGQEALDGTADCYNLRYEAINAIPPPTQHLPKQNSIR